MTVSLLLNQWWVTSPPPPPGQPVGQEPPAEYGTSFGDQLYQEVSPIGSNHLLLLCRAIGSLWQPYHELVRDTEDGPGWSAIMDVNRAPVFLLPWLAQFVGVRVTTGALSEVQRTEIITAAGFKRGTVAAMVTAAQKHLTGPKTVIIRERDGSAYQLTVRTYVDQTPDVNAVEQALLSQKPAGIILDYAAIGGQDWAQLEDTHATWADVTTDYATWDEVVSDT